MTKPEKEVTGRIDLLLTTFITASKPVKPIVKVAKPKR